MTTPNPNDLAVQMAQYLAKVKETATPEDCAKIDACAEVVNKIEQSKTIPKNEIKIIEQIISQHVKEVFKKFETTVIKQTEIFGNYTATLLSQLFDHHGIGVCSFMNEKYEDIRAHFNQVESIVTGQEFFQKQILDQFKELRNEREHISGKDYTDHSPMDLSKDAYPSPDQDSNGCLDGDSNDQVQMNIIKEIKETAKKHGPVKTNSSTLHHKANQGDMNKSNIKTAPNSEQVPGSPESARVKNKNRDNIPHINLEKNEFWADPQMVKGRVPIVITDPSTGRESVKIEEHEFEAANDQNYRPSKSVKKRMRKRQISDERRARCEVVVHGLKETIDEDNSKLYWLSEAEKFIDFTDELSPDYLEKDGIELRLEDIEVTNRILVWTGKHDENNPLPMVVQLKDENTANAVKKAMFAAGCYNCRVHVKRGKYKKTGDNKTDKQKAEIIESLKGCCGRPSTTKAERDAAKRKKEYLASQDFQKKLTFQELKERKEVKFAYIRANYT